MPQQVGIDGRPTDVRRRHPEASLDQAGKAFELAPTDMLHEHFAAIDADGNGMLSEDEIARHRADMAAPAQ